MNLDIARFETQGWTLVDLPAPDAVWRVVNRLEQIVGGPLSDYFETDDAAHEKTQTLVTDILHADRLLTDVIEAQAVLLDQFAGPGHLIQAKPHLRIARPGMAMDNIGYHRDTDYGSDSCEISVWVPFVDLPAEGSLEVASGSHRRSDIVSVARREEGAAGVTKGSVRHRLGFPYAPHVLPPRALAGLRGVPIQVGQALLVNLGLVHGTSCNRSTRARWSADIRIAPAAFAERARPGYYLIPAAA